MAIDTSKFYYLTAADQSLADRAATFEVWAGEDYVLLINNGSGNPNAPYGTPIKLTLLSPDTYQIQMQTSNYGWERTYFRAGLTSASGIYLIEVAGASSWSFIPAPTGNGYHILYADPSFSTGVYMYYRTGDKLWLSTGTYPPDQQPQVWRLVATGD